MPYSALHAMMCCHTNEKNLSPCALFCFFLISIFIEFVFFQLCVCFVFFKHYSRCFYLFFFFSVNKNVPGSRMNIATDYRHTKWRKEYICVRIIYIVYERKKKAPEFRNTSRRVIFVSRFCFFFLPLDSVPLRNLSLPSLCTRDRSYKITHTQKKKTSLLCPNDGK